MFYDTDIPRKPPLWGPYVNKIVLQYKVGILKKCHFGMNL